MTTYRELFSAWHKNESPDQWLERMQREAQESAKEARIPAVHCPEHGLSYGKCWQCEERERKGEQS